MFFEPHNKDGAISVSYCKISFHKQNISLTLVERKGNWGKPHIGLRFNLTKKTSFFIGGLYIKKSIVLLLALFDKTG